MAIVAIQDKPPDPAGEVWVRRSLPNIRTDDGAEDQGLHEVHRRCRLLAIADSPERNVAAKSIPLESTKTHKDSTDEVVSREPVFLCESSRNLQPIWRRQQK